MTVGRLVGGQRKHLFAASEPAPPNLYLDNVDIALQGTQAWKTIYVRIYGFFLTEDVCLEQPSMLNDD